MAAPALVSETRRDVAQAPRRDSELLSDQSALRRRRSHQWQHPHANKPRTWLQEHALSTIESKANGRHQHRVRRLSQNRESRVECHSLRIPAQGRKTLEVNSPQGFSVPRTHAKDTRSTRGQLALKSDITPGIRRGAAPVVGGEA